MDISKETEERVERLKKFFDIFEISPFALTEDEVKQAKLDVLTLSAFALGQSRSLKTIPNAPIGEFVNTLKKYIDSDED